VTASPSGSTAAAPTTAPSGAPSKPPPPLPLLPLPLLLLLLLLPPLSLLLLVWGLHTPRKRSRCALLAPAPGTAPLLPGCWRRERRRQCAATRDSDLPS
jgi:hypothetical protein